MGLPFAARRLYTKDGKEVRRLSDLQRDELVYVTCGEPWSDPQLSYSEQQRRTVLANLASDISHIRQYCSLRDPAGTYHLLTESKVITGKSQTEGEALMYCALRDPAGTVR